MRAEASDFLDFFVSFCIKTKRKGRNYYLSPSVL
jgi:hypothetical protein